MECGRVYIVCEWGWRGRGLVCLIGVCMLILVRGYRME